MLDLSAALSHFLRTHGGLARFFEEKGASNILADQDGEAEVDGLKEAEACHTLLKCS